MDMFGQEEATLVEWIDGLGPGDAISPLFAIKVSTKRSAKKIDRMGNVSYRLDSVSNISVIKETDVIIVLDVTHKSDNVVIIGFVVDKIVYIDVLKSNIKHGFRLVSCYEDCV